MHRNDPVVFVPAHPSGLQVKQVETDIRIIELQEQGRCFRERRKKTARRKKTTRREKTARRVVAQYANTCTWYTCIRFFVCAFVCDSCVISWRRRVSLIIRAIEWQHLELYYYMNAGTRALLTKYSQCFLSCMQVCTVRHSSITSIP